MRADGFAESFEVVATLETGNEASLATAVSPLFQSPRKVNKILVHQKQLTQRIAEIGLIASYGFDPVGNPFAPINDFFVDDLLVTATASSQPPPVPEPGFILAAVGLAGLAGWKVRRRRAGIA